MKLKDPQRKQLEAMLLASLKEGTVDVPYVLLKHYRRMKLTELEVMLIIQLIAFIDKEKNDFPTLEEIQARMSASVDHVIGSMQKLINEKYMAIDENIDAASGIQYERYNLEPLYEKLAEIYVEEQLAKAAAQRANEEKENGSSGKDVYSIIEKEFARPLTPMELETISNWLDKDQYREELILAALKEAVFAGKVHFRYIDRILLDWSRNRVSTVQQAKEYAQKFRQSR
jgi:DNA replication protein